MGNNFQAKITRKNNTSIKKYEKQIQHKSYNLLESLLKHGQNIALSHKKGKKDKNLILYEIDNQGKILKGRLFTNFDYATFLEYGTGKLSDGEMEHIGHTDTFKKSGMTYWWIPPNLSKDGEWHIVTTQEAHPFMRPTSVELRAGIPKRIIEKMK